VGSEGGEAPLPDQLILCNTGERQAAHVAAKLEEVGGQRVVCTAGPADVRATLTCLVAKLQRFCNTKTQSPPLVKVVLIGSDTFINSLLRPYVEVFSSKPPDWQSYVRFFIVPLTGGGAGGGGGGPQNTVAGWMGVHDPVYASLFCHESGWKELLEKAEPSHNDVTEMVSRIEQYISQCGPNIMHLPVAEAMVTYKEKSLDEESSQVFVPFISDVRVGAGDSFTNWSLSCGSGGTGSGAGASFEDESMAIAAFNAINASTSSSAAAMSPPSGGVSDVKAGHHGVGGGSGGVGGGGSGYVRLTPPSSPHVGNSAFSVLTSSPISSKDRADEAMDLQLDYWTVVNNNQSIGSLSSSNQAAGSSDNAAASAAPSGVIGASSASYVTPGGGVLAGASSLANQSTLSTPVTSSSSAATTSLIPANSASEDQSSNKPTKTSAVASLSGGASGASGGATGSAAVLGVADSGMKYSIKSSIWFMQIQRLGLNSSLLSSSEATASQILQMDQLQQQPTFSMQYRLKEKKQKTVMRLGKRKDKERGELAEISKVEGITRLICLSKGQSPLKVFIDGLEWQGVKFFQLSSQWQTHIKYFPVATFKTIP